MRHRVAHRKLGRVTEHRIAMLRNQAEALLRHERIETTVPKAKELRPFVERIITIAKRGLAAGDANGRSLHARRLVLRDIQNRDVVAKLFDTLAPRFEARPGGYTRILRLGFRRGDSAEVAQIELVGSEFNPERRSREGREAGRAEPKPKKGARPRFFRGKKPRRRGEEAGEGDAPNEESQARSARRARAARPTRAARASRPPRRGRRRRVASSDPVQSSARNNEGRLHMRAGPSTF